MQPFSLLSAFEVYIKVKRSRTKVTGNENVKVVFRVYLRQKWIKLSKTILHILWIHFTSGNAFLWFLSICHILHFFFERQSPWTMYCTNRAGFHYIVCVCTEKPALPCPWAHSW